MYFGVASNDDARQPDAKDKLKEAFAAAGVPAEIEVYPGALHGWCVPDMAPRTAHPSTASPMPSAPGASSPLYTNGRSPKRPSRNTHNWEVRTRAGAGFPVAARHWRQDRRATAPASPFAAPNGRSCPRKIAKLLKRLETSVQKWANRAHFRAARLIEADAGRACPAPTGFIVTRRLGGSCVRSGEK